MSEAIADELIALRDDNGVIHPVRAVAWARENKQSRLHQTLEWDDKIAGERYRIWQVRQLIAVHIVDVQGERTVVSLSIDRQAAGGYRAVEDVLRIPNLREVMLRDALDELQRVQGRYQHVEELVEVWRETDRAARRHGRRPVPPRQQRREPPQPQQPAA